MELFSFSIKYILRTEIYKVETTQMFWLARDAARREKFRLDFAEFWLVGSLGQSRRLEYKTSELSSTG